MSNPANLDFQLKLLHEMSVYLKETQNILAARMEHYEGNSFGGQINE